VVPAGTRTAGGEVVTPSTGAPACVADNGVRRARARVARKGALRLSWAGSSANPVRVDVFQQSRGRAITGDRRIRTYRGRTGSRRFSAAGRPDGLYIVRFQARTASGALDARRRAFRLVNGRFRKAPAYARRASCALVRRFKLERPVFGGRTERPLNISFRFGVETRATVTIRDPRGRVVKRFGARAYPSGLVHRLRWIVRSRHRRGVYTVTLAAGDTTQRLRARRL
jgi:hypothetical protein